MKLADIIEKIVGLAQEADANFLELSKLLRVIHDDTLKSVPNDNQMSFAEFATATGIGVRRAYYLVEIDRVYGVLNLLPKLLIKIGWTKLALLAKQIDAENYEYWLALADEHTADELRAKLAQAEPIEHVVSFRLTGKQYQTVVGALLAHGAHLTTNNGIANKGPAIVRVCQWAEKGHKLMSEFENRT